MDDPTSVWHFGPLCRVGMPDGAQAISLVFVVPFSGGRVSLQLMLVKLVRRG